MDFQKGTKIFHNESCELQTDGLRGIPPAFYNPESAAAKGLVSLAFADKQHSRLVIHDNLDLIDKMGTAKVKIGSRVVLLK